MEVCRLATAVLGRPKCIFETNRVDLRPEKSEESSDFEGGREEREGKLGFGVVVGPGGGLAAFRVVGVCEDLLLRESFWEVQF